MTTNTKPETKDNLRSPSLPDVEKRLESSPDVLSQAEAEWRLAQTLSQ